MSELRRIFYASRATPGCDSASIRALLQTSRRHNARLDITGCLLFSGTYFAQVVEGRGDAVHALLERIKNDDRHTSFRVLREEALTRRKYGAWAMGYLYDLSVEQDVQDLLFGEQPTEDAVSSVMGQMELDTVMGALG